MNVDSIGRPQSHSIVSIAAPQNINRVNLRVTVISRVRPFFLNSSSVCYLYHTHQHITVDQERLRNQVTAELQWKKSLLWRPAPPSRHAACFVCRAVLLRGRRLTASESLHCLPEKMWKTG